MSEVANIQENVTDGIKQMIAHAHELATYLKRPGFLGRDFLQEIIVVGYCTMYMSGMSSSSMQQIIENTLEYFNSGLYDTNMTTGRTSKYNSSFIVRAWVYTPDTHNDAGEWFCIYTFNNSEYADKCITMLKEIESELKKIN